MINQNDSRLRYIGASDNKYVIGSFNNKTFNDWWAYKNGIISKKSIENKYTIAGNIVEGLILDYINIPKEYRNTKIILPNSHIGCNYDALLPDMVIECKTMKEELARNILLGYSIPILYTRQMDHEMHVSGYTKARIYIQPMTEKDYDNPFGIDLENMFYRDYELPDISNYIKRLNYLDMCFKEIRVPSDQDFLNWSKTN